MMPGVRREFFAKVVQIPQCQQGVYFLRCVVVFYKGRASLFRVSAEVSVYREILI